MFKLVTFKNLQLLWVASFFCVQAFSQGKVRGKITDATTNEPLIGASVIYGEGKGVAADMDGNFEITLPNGQYSITVSYVSYKSATEKVVVANNTIELDFKLQPTMLSEVEVVSDLAKPRETPVAFSNVTAEQIKEKLGSQDLPMLLNVTPGVYVSQRDGTDGQAEVRIRGFSAQNVVVMVDGIPMNDMHNGRVYWSNWQGLGVNTKLMQVQRGLGASKLAIPSVGGSLNVITQGIDMEKVISIRQDYGNRNNLQTTISASSGKLKGGWNFQGSLAFKYNEGWVDATTTTWFSYYFKVNKQIKNHTLSFTVFGAPQWSNQRSYLYDLGIEAYNKQYAMGLGVDTSTAVKERNWRYNQGWGYIRRTRPDEGGAGAPMEALSTTRNEYYKPVYAFRDFVKVNDKFYVSAIAYASIGVGGGTQLDVTNVPLDSNGQLNLQTVYDGNAYSPFNNYVVNGDTLKKSSNFIRMNHNEHNWYGLLGTFDYAFNSRLSLSGGLDFRYFQGRVYSTINDLLGGDLAVQNPDPNVASKGYVTKGDKIRQNLERDILWGGAFAMLEYKHPVFSAFVNASTAITAYNQKNLFAKKQLVLSDTTLNIGYYDTLVYNGNTYTRDSKGLRYNESGFFTRWGFTVKGGMNFKVHQNHNVFFNVGYFTRAPYMTFLVLNTNEKVRDAQNENLASFELGYTVQYKKFAANLNAYYTLWMNKPERTTISDLNGNQVSVNVNGLQARHMGLELDFTFKPIKQLSFEGSVSLGDWTWNSVGSAILTDELGVPLPNGEKQIDLRGIKVGDQPQHQYAAVVRIAPIKGLYIAPEIIYFTNYYAQYNASTYVVNQATGVSINAGRQPWRLPDYYIMNLNMGYGFKVKKTKIDLRANFMNLTNNFFISDAYDGSISTINSFSAASAAVNIGLGFRYMGSVQVTF
jgi:iron complex outermembrane receptor protein